MYKKGDRVGNYTILSDKTKKINYKIYYYCKNVHNRCTWVRRSLLKKAHTKGAVGNQGWSTRTKNKHLPMYVYEFPNGDKKYRVCKKVDGTVLTIGYYATLEEAERMALNEN